eukprot:6353198-Pyramimonas_sp.AAC.1
MLRAKRVFALAQTAERALSVYHFPGIVSYTSALTLQEDLAEMRHKDMISDTLLVLQVRCAQKLLQTLHFNCLTTRNKCIRSCPHTPW